MIIKGYHESIEFLDAVDTRVIYNPLRFPRLPRTHQVLQRKSGYIKLDTKATLLVGAGFKEGSKHHDVNGSQPDPSLSPL